MTSQLVSFAFSRHLAKNQGPPQLRSRPPLVAEATLVPLAYFYPLGLTISSYRGAVPDGTG